MSYHDALKHGEYSTPYGKESPPERDLRKALEALDHLEAQVKMLGAENDRLSSDLLRARMIAAQVPADVYIKAKEAAGFGNQVLPKVDPS